MMSVDATPSLLTWITAEDLPECLFTKKAISKTSSHDRTAEFLGIAGSLDGSNPTMFKFVIRHKEGDKIQVIAYQDEEERVRRMIRDNYYVLLDGVHAKPKTINSTGTTAFDLIVSSLTSITVLQKNFTTSDETSSEITLTDVPVYQDLDAVMGIGGKVIIEGYLKFAIGMISMPNNSTISQGCLAHLELKNIIEIRLKTIQTCDIPVGQQIKVMGEIVCSSNFRPYLLVNDVSDIIQVENGKRN